MEDRKPTGGGLMESPGVASSARTNAVKAPATLAVRDRVIAHLGDAFANGVLEVDEFERRVTLAHQSEVGPEIEALVRDLPPPSVALATPAAPPRTLVPSRDVKARGMVFSVMGGVQRQGSWSVPRHLDVVTVMGGAQLDFRQARLPEGEVEVRIGALMGGVEIIVPPTLAVESNGAAIMGGFEHVDRAPATAEPGSTVLRVTGLALMGGVHIEMRLPGESSREARKRRRAEARAERKLVDRQR
jgi:hypothetical protein